MGPFYPFLTSQKSSSMFEDHILKKNKDETKLKLFEWMDFK